MTDKFSCRALLRGSGGATIALPFLASLAPRGAQASQAARFVTWLQPLSIYYPLYIPTAPGLKPFNRETDPLPTKYFPHAELGPFDNPNFTLPYLLEPLAAYKDQLLVVEGLTNATAGHDGYGAGLLGLPTPESTKTSRYMSLDQMIAEKVGSATKFPSLQLGVVAGTPVSYYAQGRPAPPTSRPDVIFDRLFSDVRTDPEAAARLRAQNQSILDAALEQATTLRGKLGAEDVRQVDNYLTSVRELETKLAKASAEGCEKPEAPGTLPNITVHKHHDKIPDYAKLQLEMLAMAFACDLSRVATFQLSDEANNYTFPWLGVKTRWHDQSHLKTTPDNWADAEKQQSVADYLKICRWSFETLAFFVDRLEALGALNDTLLMFLTNLHHGGQHNGRSVPAFTLGNVNNRLRTGRHLSVFKTPGTKGQERRTNDLLVTVAQLFDLNVTQIGTPEYNQGPIAEMLR